MGERDLLEWYRRMVLIRAAEQALVRLFAMTRLPRFVHSYIGQEATALGVCSALRPSDYITSTHRGHGHGLAKGGSLRSFFADLYGKPRGIAGGKVGAIHVTDLDLASWGVNGIVGVGVPIADAAAPAAKMPGRDRVPVAFLGDGATDIGVAPAVRALN